MPKVIADITMSLDGFVTGEGADERHGLGDAPELHTWVMQQDPVDTEKLEQATAESGAVVMGRRLFDTVNAPDAWNEDMGYGADQTGTPPFVVVIHTPPQDVRPLRPTRTAPKNGQWTSAQPRHGRHQATASTKAPALRTPARRLHLRGGASRRVATMGRPRTRHGGGQGIDGFPASWRDLHRVSERLGRGHILPPWVLISRVEVNASRGSVW
jgi:hypothetical protein